PLPVACLLLLALPPLPGLMLAPERFAGPWLQQVGDWGGWLALLATAGAWLIAVDRLRSHVLAATALCAGIWAAGTIAHVYAETWIPYHTLTVVWALCALVAVALGGAFRNHWRAVFCGLVTVLAVRAAMAGPAMFRAETIALGGFFLLAQLAGARLRWTA